MNSSVNSTARAHLLKTLAAGLRFDGRGPLDFRDVSVETGVIQTAEGSALVRIGNTQVLAGVKFSLEKPYPDTPDKGNFMVNAELLPLSSPDFEPGPPSEIAIEVARVIDRTIREAQAIDLKSLCVEPGEQVWGVSIDICPLNSDGNLIDAGGLAAIAALRSAKFPEVKDGTINYKKLTDKGVSLAHVSLPVTVSKVGDELIVDVTAEEEELVDARITAGVRDDGKLCAMQKGGETPLSIEEVSKMAQIAVDKFNELKKVLA